ncbi:3-deoxy-D-manno-octulosonic acid kinase [Spiribacter pallidus]|uniref:3-deoxy-D-manno-octulosonic acid kinase n=1 Tax=Spiribacter pallidus TaxID=1987936 RepID=A0ABV3TE42_9GAMM
MPHLTVQQHGNRYFISPTAVTSDRVDALAFDPDQLAAAGRIDGEAQGRSKVWFFRWQQTPMALRHYQRGGLPARFSRDRYLWRGIENTRVWRELRITDALYRHGLPVPPPVAGRVIRRGLFYTADLITQRLSGTRPLSDRVLARDPAGDGLWQAIGKTLRRFHDAGAGHADLNVRNILIGEANTIWLIDWDQGRLNADLAFQARSLQRLWRSIQKEPALAAAAASGWPALMAAYKAPR